jgi:hypothetical protein
MKTSKQIQFIEIAKELYPSGLPLKFETVEKLSQVSGLSIKTIFRKLEWKKSQLNKLAKINALI